MVNQGKGFVGDYRFELVLGCARAGDVQSPRLWRHMIDPVPAQRVVVDIEFARRPLDRSSRRKQPLDPHPFEVIATLASSGS
jgi:hypothetical protein